MDKKVVIGFGVLINNESIKNAAKITARYTERGYKVVVVVSAMAKAIDKLTALAHEITSTPNKREMDILLSSGEMVSSAAVAMAIKNFGYNSVSLTGRQAGVMTSGARTKARIKHINTNRIIKELNNNKIPVVAGFQGINRLSAVTNLERGGLGIIVTAIAAAINAKHVIYTDIGGSLSMTTPDILI